MDADKGSTRGGDLIRFYERLNLEEAAEGGKVRQRVGAQMTRRVSIKIFPSFKL